VFALLDGCFSFLIGSLIHFSLANRFGPDR
jgi:hypothetical protein